MFNVTKFPIIAVFLLIAFLSSGNIAKAGFNLFDKVDEEQLKMIVAITLSENGFGKSDDVLIISPQKIKNNSECKLIVFHRLESKDYRTYMDLSNNNKTYSITSIKTEENPSRYLGVPKKNDALWLKLE